MFTEEEREYQREYQIARRSYDEIQRRKSALEGKNRKLFELIESVNVGNYAPKMSEVLCIANVYNNNAVNSSMHFFRLGFLKGQRAERARRRKR